MPLPKRELANSPDAVCLMCGSSNRVRVFPAVLAEANAPARAEAALEGEAACFDHPSKRAVAACQHCGRFVCQLCSVEFAGEVWCPSCVVAGAGKARSAKGETSRTLFDSMALLLPLVSLIVYPFTVIAAPASLVLSVMKWRQPISLVRRNRWRFVAAISISLAEIAAWTFVIVYIASGRLARSE